MVAAMQKPELDIWWAIKMGISSKVDTELIHFELSKRLFIFGILVLFYF